jgi:ATP-dependent RNA helicase DeaD
MTMNENFAGLPAPISAALDKKGFEDLTTVQKAVIEAASDGRDLRISSQTGSGKTVAFGIALAEHFIQLNGSVDRSRTNDKAAHPTALVIVPTRELAAQVCGELHWLYENLREMKVEVVTGGTSIPLERRALSRGPAIIVGTPGRLLDHLRNKAIKTDRIEHVVLDEADQMLDMGFREELEAILEQLPEKRASHLVSATFPRPVLSLANRYQSEPLVIEGTALGVANADIQHVGYAIRRHETYPALVNVLLLANEARCLIFVNRRVDATDLAEKLAADGFGAAPFSGELAQAQRTRTLASFRNGTLPILVSTEVAARGIDVPGIATVIHVDPPRTADAYTHRSGRTGRAGQAGRSLLFATPADMGRVKRMLGGARVDLSWQPVPTPEKVEKALRKAARRALHEVVASLLALSTPESQCKPKSVVGFDPSKERAAGGRNDRSDRGARPGRGGANAGGGGRPDPDKFTRFFVSWGGESGATTGRLLGQVCRRGGIESHQVGAIEVAARVSFVAVANEVAADFEKRASREDSRDPGIIIKRAEDRPGAPKMTGRPGNAGPGRSGGPPSGPSSQGGYSKNGPPRGPAAGPSGPSAPSGGYAARPASYDRADGPPKREGRRQHPNKPKGFKKPGGFKSKGPGQKPGQKPAR